MINVMRRTAKKILHSRIYSTYLIVIFPIMLEELPKKPSDSALKRIPLTLIYRSQLCRILALVGVKVIVTGISPAIAQKYVQLNIELDQLEASSSLQLVLEANVCGLLPQRIRNGNSLV
ncbi:hypothetical protein D9754_05495 [Planomicrobium sp. Y74]|nr:hypothetical protein D9754_05495 [Planomicrobium sp. Y74]